MMAATAVAQPYARLGGFIAISIALHFFTALGVGTLELGAHQAGEPGSARELHATLAPGVRVTEEPAVASARSAPEPVPDVAPGLAPDAGQPPPGAAVDQPGLALPSPERWYTAREVDVRAQPLSEVNLSYPPELRGRPVVGKVHLRLFIDERGVVRKTQIAASEPDGMFDAAAKQAWEEVKFSPAIRNGMPVKSQKLLELLYQPELRQ